MELPPLFQGLDDQARETVSGLLLPMQFQPREQLFAQGDPSSRAFFIESGEVDVDVRLPGGRVSRLTTIGGGRVLGELSLMSEGHRRTATATAAEQVHCLVMERRDLLGLCAHYHPSAPAVLGKLADHVAGAVARVNRERILLGRAPVARDGEVRAATLGAGFDIRRHLSALEFARELNEHELDELVKAGRVFTLPACGTPPKTAGRAWYLVLRGAVSMCARSAGQLRRLSLVGPGAFAASDAFVGHGRIGSRDGATLLALSEQTVESWRSSGERWTHPALQSLLRGLMTRLAEDTRSLARERRLAGAIPGSPYAAEVMDA